MKFWIDENIPRPVIKPLQRAEHEIFTAPSRSSDVTILRLALKENAVIITRDQDFRKYGNSSGQPREKAMGKGCPRKTAARASSKGWPCLCIVER